MKNLVYVFCLMSLVLGCGRDEQTPTVVATNVVTVTRELVVTNAVTVTVTNVVVEKREPVRILSARKTAPYVVSSPALDEGRLRKLLSDAGARVIDCAAGSVAFVEASDKAVGALKGVATVQALQPEDKVAADAGERVRVLPLSSIDVAAVADAVRACGGELVQVTTVGQPCVRAKISYKGIRKLASRGDVRRIERDGK